MSFNELSFNELSFKGFCAVIFILAVLLLPLQPVWGNQKDLVSADAAVLMDAATGQVLYEKNARQCRPPASTTKIATALVAIKIGDLKNKVIVSERAAGVGESSIRLVPGEEITLDQLVTGALLKSGNDACAAIAESLGGTEEMFMKLVNGRLKFLGAENTFFVNSNGLPSPDHVSTAYDLAVIARYALSDHVFSRIVSTRSADLHRQNQWLYHINNTNKLLWRYPGATGVKTGTTRAAGSCLVGSARKDGKSLISVVLHSDDRYGDTEKLLDYGFNNFTPYKAVEKGEILSIVKTPQGEVLELAAGESLTLLKPQNSPLNLEKSFMLKKIETFPVKRGEFMGSTGIFVNGKPAGRVSLVANNDVYPDSWKRRFVNALGDLF